VHLVQHNLEEHLLADIVDVELFELNNFVSLIHVLDLNGLFLGFFTNRFDLSLRFGRINVVGVEFLFGVFWVNMCARLYLIVAEIFVNVV
jgi:hypothetical protein